MSFYYFDTSALVKYYVVEPGSQWVTGLIDEANKGVPPEPLHTIFLPAIGIVEAPAAFSVLQRQRLISRGQRDIAFARFLADLQTRFKLI